MNAFVLLWVLALTCLPSWAQVSAVTLGVPSTGYGGANVNLSWTQSGSASFASYRIYRGVEAGVTAQNGTLLITITNRNQTYFSDSTASNSVAPGTTYFYTVAVVGTANPGTEGQSVLSNERSITLVNAVPQAVTIQSLSAGYTGSSVNLSWNQTYESDFASYRIYRGTVAGVTPANGTLVTTITSANTTYYTDLAATNSPPPGTTYHYIVAVVDGAAQVAASAEKSIVLVNNFPGAVTINSLYAGYTGSTANLNWSQNYESDFASYKIYRGTTPGVTAKNGTLLTTITTSNTTYYTDSKATYSVAPGTSYHYVVSVVDQAGQETLSAEKSITLVDKAPAAVTINYLSAGYTGSGASLSWNQSYESDFASYKIYRATSPGVTPANGTLVTTITSANNTYYTDTAAIYSIPPGTTYYYVVCVVDVAGQVTPSAEKSIKLVNNPPQATTINYLSAGYTGNGTSLSWNQNYESDFASYKVYRGTTPGVTSANGTLLTTITTSNNTYYSDSTATYSVAPGTTYYYVVCTVDVAGQATPSAEKSITLINKKPDAVTINYLSPGYTGNGVSLSWNQSYENDFVSYKVYRGLTPGVTPENGVLLTTITTSNATYYTDSAATSSTPPGTTYYYIVCVVDSAEQITSSAERSITLVNAPPSAATLNDLYVGSYPNDVRVALSWNQNYENDFASYKIYRSTTPGATPENGTLLTTLTRNDNTYYADTTVVYGAPPGTTYYYRIYTFDGAGQNTPSNERSVTLLDEAPLPVVLNAPISKRASIDLSWSASSLNDFGSYQIYRSTTPNINAQNATLVTTIANSNTTYYRDASVPLSPAPGVTYYYRVFVVDRGGQNAASNEVSVVRVENPSQGTIVYGNNASFGNVTIEAFDLSTGELVDQFIVPNSQAANDNGRGVVVIGDTIYYTTANSGNVYKMNKTTHADQGVAFTTLFPGIACLAWDGSAIWLIPYQGRNDAYRYTPEGQLLQIVNGFGNSRDGFEIANNYIVANRGDAIGPYDLYSLDGTLVQAAFINPDFQPTGITFDGEKFIVSKIFDNQLAVYSSTGTLEKVLSLDAPYPTFGRRLLEDLSSLGNIASNTVAEPGTR